MNIRIPVSRIMHTIHAVEDIHACRRLYQDALGGLVFAEGFEPKMDRDMALLYVTNHMIEPMAPRTLGDMQHSFARFLNRYGEGWHSFELKVPDAAAAAAKLKAAGCRLVETPYPVFFFVHGDATGGLLIEVCERPMPNDPYDRGGWNPGVAHGMPSGVLRLDHIACVLRDVDAAERVLTEMFDGTVLSDAQITSPQPARRVLIEIGGDQVALIAPVDADTGPLGAYLAGHHTGVYALVWQVEDEARARAAFAAMKMEFVTNTCVGGSFGIDPAHFMGARHEFVGGA